MFLILREAIDVSALEVVWFEEGDGVAVLEAGDPLFVIPGWSDMGRGIPGYARDATEQSPFAFPMEEEIAEFGPRIERAREHWKMCRADGSWAEFQQSVNRYIADFEAMLRRVLAERDGGIIAVTLMSSDMGKLYAALAQIDRRR